jgi:hypothetical protein
VVLMDVCFVGEFGQLESGAGFFGGVPSYVVQEAGAGCYAVEQIRDGGGDGEGGSVVDA